MIFVSTPFEGLYEIHHDKKGDERGWFLRGFDAALFQKAIPNFDAALKQINHSYNAKMHTWRGFHYQKPPFQETKIIRCIRGAILDCVVDLREDSSTYLQTYQTELSASNTHALFVPKGFAHGFLTLEDDTEILYLHDEYYTPDQEAGLRYDDPKIKFTLPYIPKVISDRDKNHTYI